MAVHGITHLIFGCSFKKKKKSLFFILIYFILIPGKGSSQPMLLRNPTKLIPLGSDPGRVLPGGFGMKTKDSRCLVPLLEGESFSSSPLATCE